LHRVEFDIPEVSLIDLLGPEDRLLRELEAQFPGVSIHNRGHKFQVSGESSRVDAVARLITELAEMVATGVAVDSLNTRDSARMIRDDLESQPAKVLSGSIIRTPFKSIRAKTQGQQRYLQAIAENTVIFGIGPAGTGKTYLAVAKAVEALYAKQVSRIVLTRPAVEAGERLGFLPGSLSEKIDPYLRPLFDALQEMLGADLTAKMMETNVIEVAPLAYMRGRTLNDAFVILDEAQNTTHEQMKMFLTRLGFSSKMVITGDVTQVDLPGGKSGLNHAAELLSDIEGIHFSKFSSADVVRHELVTKIVEAYDRGNQ
jgi:phosphate starvation-inducible protein PhoH and related proteins